MTLIEAIQADRPMRRRHDNTDATKWIFLGIATDAGIGWNQWRNIATGAPLRLNREDYLAEDWEVMP